MNKYSYFLCYNCDHSWVKSNPKIKNSKCYYCGFNIFRRAYYHFHCYPCKRTWRKYMISGIGCFCGDCKKFIPIRIYKKRRETKSEEKKNY